MSKASSSERTKRPEDGGWLSEKTAGLIYLGLAALIAVCLAGVWIGWEFILPLVGFVAALGWAMRRNRR